MDRMLYTAMTGATEMVHAQTITANNLANASTTGFKKDLAVMMHHPVRREDDSRHYAVATTKTQDFEQGHRIQTNRALDVAVDGEGWLAVAGQNGSTGYSRAGSLNVSADGFLRDRSGRMVLGNEGAVSIPPNSRVEIASDGTVNVFGTGEFEGDLAIVDRIMLVNPKISEMEKSEDGLFRMKDGTEAEPAAEVQLVSGALEGSNVSPIESMAQMIQMSRQYEMQVKMMKKADELAGRSSSILRIT
ncbi:MAG: flagellar basal body rod protein FlgF [Gammaproteobacteria bacterium]|jgi:flagellar basal-body rod protein FlgF|nr:flagellar basal body rod protein FlgF [Gammaproteobacteria bacterium]MBT3488977.1 flagellar basal body rod protein FlgF [Gammaproteobacteria bacterium]MBT3717455.1 flagellar basal body rod protein FlgF [Gammaproteobacteria bacterium]MBT3844623.1 flagellar basal body rod protein FlgF [Gammaproteobacteria bacterium]MBT3892768.1 flagellar basal body rod protein FlgF [Gammaproteobacteria bacterium]